MNKRIITLGAAITSLLVVTACGGSGEGDTDEVKVCVNEYVTLPILEEAFEGLEAGLEEGGYVEGDNLELEVRNPEGDAATQQTIASQFLGDASCSVLVGFTTPGSQAFLQSSRETPLVFFASSAPVDAKLVESMDEPGNNTTGVSDPLPVELELKAMRDIDPGVETVGLIWKNGDASGDALAARAKTAAQDAGVTVVEAPIANASETTQAARSLVGRVDAIQVAGDGPTVSGVAAILKVAADAGLPVFGGTTESVDQGALVAGVHDYGELGKEAGLLVARILDGEDAGSIAVHVPTETAMSVNRATLDELGLEVPDGLDVTFSEGGDS